MAHGIIRATTGFVLAKARSAMQGSEIRGLVEIITNCDDSYRIQEQQGGILANQAKKIEITYEKQGNSLIFSIRDYARGMSAETIEETMAYGGDTSGMSAGMNVRGRFGKGLKDTLIGLSGGKIYSFHNGNFAECEVYVEDEKAKYKINDDSPNMEVKATKKLRALYGIPANGTLVTFKRADYTHIPRFDTILENLSNNFLLRKILTDPKRKLTLTDVSASKSPKRVHYSYPKSISSITDSFAITYNGTVFPIQFNLEKSKEGLSQSGDDRIGGLLLLDDKEVVLGISLFKFDMDPLAAHYFGEVVIGGFRDLEIKKEQVLHDERDGLLPRHPFNKELISELEKRIEKIIQDDKNAQNKGIDINKKDRETTKRYNKCMNLFNQIAADIGKDDLTKGNTTSETPTTLETGLAFQCPVMCPTIDKAYTSRLFYDTKKVHHGDIINLTSSDPQILINPPQITVMKEDGTGVIGRWITVTPTALCTGTVTAMDIDTGVSATAQVRAQKPDLGMEELKLYGMTFLPESITIKPHHTRNVQLRLYTRRIPDRSKITISSDNPQIEVSRKSFTFDTSKESKHIVVEDIEITSHRLGEEALIHAAVVGSPELETALEVKVSNLAPSKPVSNRWGLFNEPIFDESENPTDDVAYSSLDGKIRIYINFSPTKYYLGEKNSKADSLPAKMKVADLLCKCCFFELASRQVANSGIVIEASSRFDKIRREALKFESTYGAKIHEYLVGDLMK
jgi:Histidine kinase-, DNA gyrase B-, and HSP90-like ATPase